MIYKTVDIWGITSPDVKLEYAKTDLSEMAKNSKLEKIEDLKKHEKEVLNLLSFERLIKGKNVVVVSGPALNSLSKALKSDEAKKVLESYKLKFRNWLESIPQHENMVFVGGGTQGFEEELNKIIAEVNLNRQNKFELVGVIAGVTGGAEFDKNVKKYLPLSSAFYWDDYFTELLPLLSKTKRAKAASIQFLFGGGGAIVGKQIREVIAEIDRGFEARVALLPGLSIGMSKVSDMSATDQFIQSELGRSVIGSKADLVKDSTNALGGAKSTSQPLNIISDKIRKAKQLARELEVTCNMVFMH